MSYRLKLNGKVEKTDRNNWNWNYEKKSLIVVPLSLSCSSYRVKFHALGFTSYFFFRFPFFALQTNTLKTCLHWEIQPHVHKGTNTLTQHKRNSYTQTRTDTHTTLLCKYVCNRMAMVIPSSLSIAACFQPP